MTQIIHVAVGVVFNSTNHILIARRADHLHQGGLWEFPGGKVEPGETVLEALIREFKEEVSLQILDAKPFIKIHHDYGDKQVFLDVLLSRKFAGQAKEMEGQTVKWVNLDQLQHYPFPAANKAIIDKLQAMT